MESLHGVLLFLAIWAFRIANAFFINTYFDPDEYWQSLEIAHLQVFGYGYECWDWKARIRNWLFVLPFIAIFKALKLVGLNNNSLAIIYAPRIWQALIAAGIDWTTFKLAKRYYGKSGISNAALSLSLISFFNFSYYSRSLSNVFETLLTAIGLLWWPISGFECGQLVASTFVVGITCLIRPSAILNWIFPVAHLWMLASWSQRLKMLFIGANCAIQVICLGLWMDSSWYEQNGVLTWWNFFQANIRDKVSLLYGSNPWHFYLSQGIPLMLFTALPLAIIGVFFCPRFWPLGFVGSSVLLNSLLGHKEFRFLLPIQPVLIGLAALGRDAFGRDPSFIDVRKGWKKALLAGLLATNLGAAYYFGRWHQSGCIDVIDHLREEPTLKSVLFLTPCHSTPFYARLHRNVPMRILGCAPPVDALTCRVFGLEGYVDEADRFYKDPVGMSRRLLDGSHSHLVLFEALLDVEGMEQVIRSAGYKLRKSFFNSHFNPDHRRLGQILLYTHE